MPTNNEIPLKDDIDDEIWGIAEDYEEKLAKSARGGAKGGGKKKKERRALNSKTEKGKRKNETENREKNRAEEIKPALTKIIEGFPKFKSEREREDFLETYVEWLARNLEHGLDKEIPENEIEYEFMLSSKHGGQRGDKSSTAARATHLPTNISVKNQEESNQQGNRRNALRILREDLNQHIKNWREFLENSKGDEADNIFEVIYGKSE